MKRKSNKKGRGWRNEPGRHSLAAKGVKTTASKVTPNSDVTWKKMREVVSDFQNANVFYIAAYKDGTNKQDVVTLKENMDDFIESVKNLREKKAIPEHIECQLINHAEVAKHSASEDDWIAADDALDNIGVMMYDEIVDDITTYLKYEEGYDDSMKAEGMAEDMEKVGRILSKKAREKGIELGKRGSRYLDKKARKLKRKLDAQDFENIPEKTGQKIGKKTEEAGKKAGKKAEDLGKKL